MSSPDPGKYRHERDTLFRAIAEQTTDFISLCDAQGVITYASPAALTLFQCSPEEMRGRHFIEFLAEPSVPAALAAFCRGRDPGEPALNLALASRELSWLA